MDPLSNFLERQSNRLVKIDGLAIILAGVCILTSVITVENGKPFGFVMAIIGLWFFGFTMIVRLYHRDQFGESKVSTASPLIQFICSAFHICWFLFLAFLTVDLYAQIHT